MYYKRKLLALKNKYKTMVITRIKEERKLDFTVISFETDATTLSANGVFLVQKSRQPISEFKRVV